MIGLALHLLVEDRQRVIVGRTAQEGAFVDQFEARRRYFARLSGPLLDRVDLRVSLRPLTAMSSSLTAAPEPSATVRARVQSARDRAVHRWRAHGWRSNSEVPGPSLRREFLLPASTTVLLEKALTRGALTARGADRCLRIAWTLADLAGTAHPTPDHVSAALDFRERTAA